MKKNLFSALIAAGIVILVLFLIGVYITNNFFLNSPFNGGYK